MLGRGTQWYYWKSARYGDKEERKGPYSSLASVTLMIARQLRKEVQRRDVVHLPE
jgi:hypothetical protein